MRRALNESALARWAALFLISLVMFATYYFYDVYSGIKSTLQTEIGLSNADYGMMYGAYSFTNSFLLMAFLGGMILDRWGIRKTGIVFISLIVIGTLGTAFGASGYFHSGTVGYGFLGSFLQHYSPALKLMVLGRIIFGLGAETFYVILNKIIAKWFKTKELALAFGINVAFGRFGTAAALILSPRIVAHAAHWTSAGWFGIMLILIALIAFIFYLIIDFRFDRQMSEMKTAGEPDNFSIRDIGLLLTNKSFIFIVLLCVTFYSAVFPFLGFAPDFLMNKFHFTPVFSGKITSLLPFGTVVFTPLFGWWCDVKGKSASIMILGSFLLICVHLIFSLTSLTPYVPLVILGIAFSLVPAAMWPAVAKIVEVRRLGTAYGFMFTIQNYGLMLVPLIMGKVLDATNKNVPAGGTLNYFWTIILLAGFGILGILFAILLKRDDKRMGYGLELPNKISE